MMIGVPLATVFILISWLLMTRLLYRFELDDLPGGREMIDEEITKLGLATQGEKMVALVFASAAFLWVVPGCSRPFPAWPRGWACSRAWTIRRLRSAQG